MPELSGKIQMIGTLIFAMALLHSFWAAKILNFSHRFPKGSGLEALFHLLGEVEIVFGLWGGLMLIIFSMVESAHMAVQYQSALNFTEPIFVFCIMIVAATKPILNSLEWLISRASLALQKISKIPRQHADFLAILIFGPLAGSLITEPAAMTVTAFLIATRIKNPPGEMLYFLLATLFVNVSIGGALTSFAAPPILMVAGKWGWDSAFVFCHLGWKSAIAVVANSFLFLIIFWKKLPIYCKELTEIESSEYIPLWVRLIHFLFLAAVIIFSHYQNVCMGFLLFFMGFTMVSKRYQNSLRIRESLLVAFFLGGIVMFGPLQAWWLSPLLKSLNELVLFAVATCLTAVTDNAALTFLGAQIENLTDASKYYLVAGAIAGGGLTIIANAPNAAGYSVLHKFFPEGLNAAKLFKAALLPTAIAVILLELPFYF